MEVLLSVWIIIAGFPCLSSWFRIEICMQLFHLPLWTLSYFRFSQHACKYYGQLHCLLELIMHHVIQANDKFLVTHHFDKHYDFKFTSVSDLILNILPSISYICTHFVVWHNRIVSFQNAYTSFSTDIFCAHLTCHHTVTSYNYEFFEN